MEQAGHSGFHPEVDSVRQFVTDASAVKRICTLHSDGGLAFLPSYLLSLKYIAEYYFQHKNILNRKQTIQDGKSMVGTSQKEVNTPNSDQLLPK